MIFVILLNKERSFEVPIRVQVVVDCLWLHSLIAQWNAKIRICFSKHAPLFQVPGTFHSQMKLVFDIFFSDFRFGCHPLWGVCFTRRTFSMLKFIFRLLFSWEQFLDSSYSSSLVANFFGLNICQCCRFEFFNWLNPFKCIPVSRCFWCLKIWHNDAR